MSRRIKKANSQSSVEEDAILELSSHSYSDENVSGDEL